VTRCPACGTEHGVAVSVCSFCGRSFSPLHASTRRVRLIQLILVAALIALLTALAVFG
jgi:hypothetical protein